MRKSNTTAVHGEASVLLSVLPPVLLSLRHISAEKQRLSLAKIFNSPCVCDENKSPRQSALLTELRELPPENSLRPLE